MVAGESSLPPHSRRSSSRRFQSWRTACLALCFLRVHLTCFFSDSTETDPDVASLQTGVATSHRLPSSTTRCSHTLPWQQRPLRRTRPTTGTRVKTPHPMITRGLPSPCARCCPRRRCSIRSLGTLPCTTRAQLLRFDTADGASGTSSRRWPGSGGRAGAIR